MTPHLPPIAITGIGSVSPHGPLAGLIPPSLPEPTVISGWTTVGQRRAFLVPPFRAANVVPGVKTRRLDRLSVWALVASSLAIQDAGIDLSQVDRSRVAVVLATAFGCVELTQAFYLSAAANGWHQTDPITFPETLASAPASHISMFHNFRGPNVTLSNKHFSGEIAMIQAAGLLRQGQADLAIVLAGDALARSTYSWYEVADLLSPACSNAPATSQAEKFIPSEGLAAFVMETSDAIAARPKARPYARIGSGLWRSGGQPTEIVRSILAGSVPSLVICGGDGTPCATSPTSTLAREIAGDGPAIIPPSAFAQGLAGAGALFHLILALNRPPVSGLALYLGTARNNGFAALVLELP